MRARDHVAIFANRSHNLRIARTAARTPRRSPSGDEPTTNDAADVRRCAHFW
jgi:hypothetical protein